MAAGVSRALALHDVSFHDVWEALTALEPPIAAAAARARKPADLERLEALHSRLDELDTAAAVEQTAEFFRADNGVWLVAEVPRLG